MKSLLITLLCLGTLGANAEPVWIEGGTFYPAVRLQATLEPLQVTDFYLDQYPVSDADYLAFVLATPKWQRSQVPAIFADSSYLSHWQNDTSLTSAAVPDQPVRRVSWFAARAYCQAQGGRLASLNEWEYAVLRWRQQQALSDKDYARLVFHWYSSPATVVLAKPQQADTVQALLGTVNEWVEDFQLLLSNGEDITMLSGSCGDTARFMAEFDSAHYATFLRYQSRSNYRPQSTTSTLGFRCAYNARSLP